MKGMKRVIAAALILMLILPVISGGSDAATGKWRQNKTGWWYSYSDGSYAKSEWLKYGGKWYYFKANGYMATGLQKIGSKYYFFGKESGAMQTGWKQISGKWYFFTSAGNAKTGSGLEKRQMQARQAVFPGIFFLRRQMLLKRCAITIIGFLPEIKRHFLDFFQNIGLWTYRNRFPRLRIVPRPRG